MHSYNKLFDRRLFAMIGLAVGLLIAGLTSPLRADDDEKPDFDQLRRQFVKAYDNANYKKALEHAEKLHELRGDDVSVIYNIACMHCLLGEKDKAYNWLEKAIDAGYSTADHLMNDYDFKTMRGEDRFRDLVRDIREKTGSPRRHGSGEEEPNGEDKADKPKKPVKEKESEDTDNSDKPKKRDLSKLSPRELGTKVGELTSQLIATSRGGDKEKSLKLALKALDYAKALREKIGEQGDGSLSLTHYNVACMYSLLGKKDKAFQHLETYVDIAGKEPRSLQQIKGDSDFDNIRDDKRYAKAVNRAKKMSRQSDAPAEKEVDFKWKVTLPEDYNKSKKAPLLVALHHYHGSMDKTAKRWKKAAGELGAVLLTPQGTVDMGEGAYHWGKDLDAIEKNTMEAINSVMDDHKIDQDRIVLAGFSQGGWITWALAMRNPDTFCGIIPVAGRFIVESESVFEDKDLASMRIFIMVGEEESSRVLRANKAAAKRFKKAGAKVKLNIYEEVGHGFPDNETEEQIKALRFVLGG